MKNKKDFFIGIDLGTTNSSIHWGARSPHQIDLLEPRPLEFDQQDSNGSIVRNALLPSFIWFIQGQDVHYVGEYARTSGLTSHPSRVAKEFKNNMGKDWRFEVDDKEFSAAELSSIVLKTMYNGIKSTWGETVEDVVVTVPASFDSDMRNDTYTAVELAGFKVTEKNGHPRNLLLDEPRAALYDLINQQAAGRLPPHIMLDLSSPKLVLVFDLGGGTLDISLHQVKQSSDIDEIDVEDLAISRYTQLGGGVFDKLIADELQRRFEERYKLRIDDLEPNDRHQTRIKLEVQAELAKRRLTNDIQHRYNQSDEEIRNDFSVTIERPFIYDTKNLITDLTKGEFESLISPLLAPELTIDSINGFDDLEYSGDNVIYPILDVLHKAEKKMGQIPKIDALVLNGGMTRVHAIQNRLQEFFDIRPIRVLNPEHAVSRGASIYHYMLHRGWRPHQILAESIGVEVEESRIYCLVPAGTVLPFQKPIQGKFKIPEEGTKHLDIPLYRGESSFPQAPNKKILERRFVFQKSQKKDTPIDVEINIDENKILHFIARLPNGETGEVQVGAEDTFEDDEDEKFASKDQSSISSFIHKPTGPPINISVFRKDLKRFSEQWDEKSLKVLGNTALEAQNVSVLIDVLNQEHSFLSRPGRQRVMWVLGEYGRLYDDQDRKPTIIKVCEDNIQKSIGNDKAISTIGRNAVHALGKIGSKIAESYLVNLINDDRVQSIRPDIFVALGKCGATINAVNHIQPFVESEKVGDRIYALWALGRLGSREREPIISILKIEDVIPAIGKHALYREEPHNEARKYAIYALGEIGDRRRSLVHNDLVNDDYAGYIIDVLKKAHKSHSDRYLLGDSILNQESKLIEIALKQVEGKKLTDDENRVLMSVRTLMSV